MVSKFGTPPLRGYKYETATSVLPALLSSHFYKSINPHTIPIPNSSTNMSAQEPSKVSGQYHSVKGTLVETVGDMTGAETWSTSGKEEHAQGETEYNAAQAKGYAEGVVDRAGGYKDSVVGAVTGDKTQQASGNARNEKGQAQQEMNKSSS
ncbi:hypothetical protein BJ138DRAFT_641237 [Hygrophoropsis aurantiaca]|uniref:Uncharacterized protein n=1 Tax=Hygrophoropsis aurantiaca TaxID=72124 RepID=A0ACB8AJI2_9AGAM|nr:hypothetical protein BJ138DRAFT_641237 [Hygrophoropsis aurantiaca]